MVLRDCLKVNLCNILFLVKPSPRKYYVYLATYRVSVVEYTVYTTTTFMIVYIIKRRRPVCLVSDEFSEQPVNMWGCSSSGTRRLVNLVVLTVLISLSEAWQQNLPPKNSVRYGEYKHFSYIFIYIILISLNRD